MTNAYSEEKFELEVIDRLSKYGWTPRPDLYFKTETELLANWRNILDEQNKDRLNAIPLTDSEFAQLINQVTTVKTPLQAGKLLANGQLELVRDANDVAGEKHFLDFFWRHDVGGGRNRYEIVRQIARKSTKEKRKDRRFDITLLISGIPVIHLELKKQNIDVQEAFYQIKSYSENGSFTGFYSLIQLFAILNPDECRYFANFGDYEKFNYKFAFPWLDFDNQQTYGTSQFIEKVLSVPMGHKLVSQYTIHDMERNAIKVLRSYQIYAVEAILDRLHGAEFGTSHEARLGGYVWHTTGSGKTMTSFKTAELASNLPNVDKVIFLADRNELVKQTIDEYSSFGDDGSITATKNSHHLLKAVNNKAKDKLIVTSIQKANKVAGFDQDLVKDKNGNDKNIVFIVDEAHRSTAGEMLLAIRERFKNAIWFGFTGTPLLLVKDSKKLKKEIDKEQGDTEQNESGLTAKIFGNPLHIYSVADGIKDGNVLAFDVRQNRTFDYLDLRQQISLQKDPSKGDVYKAWLGKSDTDIERELPEANYNDKHIENVVKDIVRKWEMNSANFLFSAMLTVKDIDTANKYYDLLKNNTKGIKVAMIYDDSDRNQEGDVEKNVALEKAIQDYNTMFNVDFGLDNVPAYKADLMDRLARRYQYKEITDATQLDLVIVVQQLLTGFDAPFLNTLYVDKALEYAGLIQAFSRTNRVTDGRKPYGIIEYYRRPLLMKYNIDKAFELYANKQAKGSMMYAESMDDNLAKIHQLYQDIAKLFTVDESGEPDFSQLPEDEPTQKQFVRWINELEETMIKLRQQGFDINDPIQQAKIPFNQDNYQEIQARYLDLAQQGSGGGHGEPKGALAIDSTLISGERILIDNAYISSLLEKINQVAKEAQTTTPNQADIDKVQDFTARFNELSNQYRQTDRELLNRILAEAKQGKLPDNISLNQLLDQYRFEREQGNISQLAITFDLDKSLFNKLLHHHVLDKDDWREFDMLKNVVKSADMNKVEDLYEQETGQKANKMTIQKYLENKVKNEIDKILRER